MHGLADTPKIDAFPAFQYTMFMLHADVDTDFFSSRVNVARLCYAMLSRQGQGGWALDYAAPPSLASPHTYFRHTVAGD